MTSTALIPFLFIAFFGLIIYLIIQVARRQAEKARQIRQQLGFIAVEPADPALVQRLTTVLAPDRGKVKVTKVYRRDHGSYALYDCRVDDGGKDDTSDERSVMVGRGWQLPSLRLLPRFGGEGRGWRFLQRLMLMAAGHGGFEEVTLAGETEFTKKYIVLSRRPDEVPRLIPHDVWSDLAAFPERLFIQADGDTVVFSTFNPDDRGRKASFETSETESLRREIETAGRLSSIFERCRSGAVDESVLGTTR